VKQNRFFPKGFTVIELLVVIIIISIVASIGTNAYQSQRAQVRYNDSVFKVLSMIQTARNYAISSRAVYDECNVGNENYIPEEGYGVYISRSDEPGLSRFVLFANIEAVNKITANQYDETGGCNSDLIEEEYFLPIDADFLSLSVDQNLPDHTVIGGNTDDEAVIIFRPPLADATIAVNDHPLDADNLVILNDFYLRFRRAQADPGIPSQYVHINRIAGFPEIEKETE